MKTFPRSPASFIFRWKWFVSLVLALLAERLFFGHPAGWTQGLFTAAVLLAFLCFNPRSLRSTAGKLTAGLLLGLAMVCVEAPNWLAGLLILAGFATLALLCFGPMPGSAVAWLRGILVYLAAGWHRPFRDGTALVRWKKKHPERGGFRWQWLVPLAFAGLFIRLFAEANPIIQQWLALLDWQWLAEVLKPTRVMYVGFMFFTLWAFLRPYRWFRMQRGVEAIAAAMPGWCWYLTDTTILKGSLLLFNALFLVQTALDALYLWGGVRLPDGMTYAEYAHRGAYPLVVTALLAGFFVLIALRPGSEAGRSPLIRGLVTLWILQNVFLTVSSALRTLLYIEVYSLSHWRIASIIWMGLVGAGLLFLLWRILRDLPDRWLINANALALLVVLYGCSVVDFDGMIAWYNVRHSEEATGRGQPLDLAYLSGESGVEAVPALIWLERYADVDDFRRQEIRAARQRLTLELRNRQAGWRGWTWRNQRLWHQAEARERADFDSALGQSGWQPVRTGDGPP